ncbi:hypothetical protein HYW21_06105 [Candidatus Woesearchaeota archaeon]|nr:hypothetical protein [Candidatus Woesearchaeota archaeon]
MGVAFAFGDRSLEDAVREIERIQRVAIIGAGTMGTGLAQLLLEKTPWEITLYDVSAEALARAQSTLDATFRKMTSVKGDLTELCQHELSALRERLQGRVVTTTDYKTLSDKHLIWEVATEREGIKRQVFSGIQEYADPRQLVAVFSNTSSHLTSELAGLFSDRSFRERFAVVHGYFPFHGNALIDVMKGPETSELTYRVAWLLAAQVLEKNTMRLPREHHGFLTDPLFEAMAAGPSCYVASGRDIVSLGGVWGHFTTNPFQVLDNTGHMPYTESARHMRAALPEHDRLRTWYQGPEGAAYPDWIQWLESERKTGSASRTGEGFFKWEHGKPVAVFNPDTFEYVPIPRIDARAFASYAHAEAADHAAGRIKSVDALRHIAHADDDGGKTFRRYVIPVLLYGLDMIQEGFGTPGQVNTSTRVGLKFKHGLVEVVDGFLAHGGVDGFVALADRAASENHEWVAEGLYDVRGETGPRTGTPSLLMTMQHRGWRSLLGYGHLNGTPVEERDLRTGEMRPSYAYFETMVSQRDRVLVVLANNPLRGNVWNPESMDQFRHIVEHAIEMYRNGTIGAMLFYPKGGKMMGADANAFNVGWYDPAVGYRPMDSEGRRRIAQDGVETFEMLRQAPIRTVFAGKELWGGGAEVSYFFDLRFMQFNHGAFYDKAFGRNDWGHRPAFVQPEEGLGILMGYNGARRLNELISESGAREVIHLGVSAERAHQLGLVHGVFATEQELLVRSYEAARQLAKSPPYSAALTNLQFGHPSTTAEIGAQCRDALDPGINPWVTGFEVLLSKGVRRPVHDYNSRGTDLPGWTPPIR